MRPVKHRLTAAVASLMLLGMGCAGVGGPPGPDHCELEVLGVESWSVEPGRADVAYRVRGESGSPGELWLIAKVSDAEMIPGFGVGVGPGPFEAIVDLKLTALPREFLVVLEVAGRRCSARALRP